jgi:CRP-like cAMP-binding protein
VLTTHQFEQQLGGAPGCCRFVKATLAERAPLPTEWPERYGFALVRRGVVIRTRAGAKGRAVAVDCVGPGGFVPLTKPSEPGANVEVGYAATPALFCLYPSEVLDHVIESDVELARDLCRGLAAALLRVERFAEARGLPRAEDRVTRVLGVLGSSLGAEPCETLPAGLQQRDIARLAGVRHESVCRILGTLERAGVVERREGELVLLQPDALEASSD